MCAIGGVILIAYIDCVYRLGQFGEMIASQFDVEKGCVKDIPEFMAFDFKGHYSVSAEWYRSRGISITDLYNVMAMYPNALVAINLNNCGIVLVLEDTFGSYSLKERQFISSFKFEVTPFKLATYEVGIVKTELRTLEVLQQVSRLIAVDLNGSLFTRVNTKGWIRLDYDVDKEYNRNVILSKYLEFCKKEDAYFLFMQNGEVQMANYDKGANTTKMI